MEQSHRKTTDDYLFRHPVCACFGTFRLGWLKKTCFIYFPEAISMDFQNGSHSLSAWNKDKSKKHTTTTATETTTKNQFSSTHIFVFLSCFLVVHNKWFHYQFVSLIELSKLTPRWLALGNIIIFHPRPTCVLVEVITGIRARVHCIEHIWKKKEEEWEEIKKMQMWIQNKCKKKATYSTVLS